MLNDLMERSRSWSAKRQAQEPGYFTRLAALQAPSFSGSDVRTVGFRPTWSRDLIRAKCLFIAT